MKQIEPLKAIIALGLIVAAIYLSFSYGFTVVQVEDIELVQAEAAFDAETFVNEYWESRLLPTVEEEAIELSDLLERFTLDENGFATRESLVPIAEEFGLITDGEAHAYMVQGRGEIVSVDTESRVGTIEIIVDGYDGPTRVLLFIGPGIPSDDSSIRDAVGFITFGRFRDQTEYGRVGREINRRVNQDVLESLERDAMHEGQQVEFRGTFMIRTFNLVRVDLNKIRIVPTHITLSDA